MCVTWSSPPPWWPSRTTRAKFTPRTWGWSPLVHRLHVCITSVLWHQFFPVSFSFFCHCWFPAAFQTPAPVQARKKPAEDPSSAPAGGGGGRDDNNDSNRFCSMCQASFNNPLMAQQHYVGKKHRKQMTKIKLMETYGPATAPGQDTRLRSPLHNSMSWFSPVACQLPRWRATRAPSVRLSWTLWSSTSLTSVEPNIITSKYTRWARYLMCLSHSDLFLPLLFV